VSRRGEDIGHHWAQYGWKVDTDATSRPHTAHGTGHSLDPLHHRNRVTEPNGLSLEVGSYVPASSAKLGVLDVIHARMGARDNILRGRSTFQHELEESRLIPDMYRADSSLTCIEQTHP